jgi:glycosyltransferase involved in cell wall biosynthesis
VQRLGVDRVLPWPIAVPELEVDRRRFCLLSVGRLHKVKNYGFLIESCAALCQKGMDILCWIVGEGPERSNLERQIVRLRLQGRVTLIGQVPRSLSAVSEAPPSEELGVETLWRGASDTAT